MYARGRVFWGIAVRSLLAVAFAALTSITAALAQTTNVPDTAPPSAFGPDPILQITTTFQARIEGLADPREVPTRTAQDTARRTFYNMAADECTLLYTSEGPSVLRYDVCKNQQLTPFATGLKKTLNLRILPDERLAAAA